jgi:hypothetical protein
MNLPELAIGDGVMGCLSHDGILHMMFKLGLRAEEKWER